MDLYYELRRYKAKLIKVLRTFTYYFEYLFWLIFSFSKFKKYPKIVKSILVINHGALGDIFCSLKTIYNLSLNNPKINLSYLVEEPFHQNFRFLEKLMKIKIITTKELSEKNFDLTIIFNSFQNLSKHRDNLGFCIGNEYSGAKGAFYSIRDLFINRKQKPLYRHKLKQEIEIVKLAGLKIGNTLKGFNKINNEKVDSLLKKNKIKDFAIIHPSGRNFADILKQGKIPNLAWPFERFSEIADYLAENYGYDVIISGSKEEKFIGDILINKCKNKKKVINFSGKLNIEELASLVSRAKLVLSVDTATAHISEFFDVKTVTLFGPTFLEEVRPYGSKDKFISICHPEKCIQDRRKGYCHGDRNICMESISVAEVKKAINNLNI